jgi:hypothetical protein
MTRPRDDRGRQKGAVVKAEGQHGDKTHRKFLEQLHSGPSGDERNNPEPAAERVQRAEGVEPDDGEHRLFEGRQQHDDAELQSEKSRLSREIERRELDREDYQVRGAGARSRAGENHPRGLSHSDPRKGRKGGGTRH